MIPESIPTNENDPVIQLDRVTKNYEHFKLQEVSLVVRQGSVTGLIGPNGAGKSTLMRIMMGLVKPDSGEVSVLRQPISSNSPGPKAEIGFFSDDMRLYKGESLAWHMELVSSIFPGWDKDYARHLVQSFGLIEQQLIKGLSHGQRVKALLLLILARRPKLLILDEPTNGLDPVAKHEVFRELMQVVTDEERTILYSSHFTQDIEQICDSIIFVDRGRVVSADDRDQFLHRWRRIQMRVPEGWEPPSTIRLYHDSTFHSHRVYTTDQFNDDLSNQLVSHGVSLESIDKMTLEEIFVSSVLNGREDQ